MEITKIKRFLGKIGIISPLNQLFYTSEEIEKMGLQKTFIKKIRKEKVNPKNIGKFQIISYPSKIKVNKFFDTRKEAETWANWNYKGHNKSWYAEKKKN
jgi:hypothetical protein